jgi:hypothetical protein
MAFNTFSHKHGRQLSSAHIFSKGKVLDGKIFEEKMYLNNI